MPRLLTPAETTTPAKGSLVPAATMRTPPSTAAMSSTSVPKRRSAPRRAQARLVHQRARRDRQAQGTGRRRMHAAAGAAQLGGRRRQVCPGPDRAVYQDVLTRYENGAARMSPARRG